MGPEGNEETDGSFAVAPTPRPSVAVVIPTYNHAKFLSAALESVLSQTRPVEEIVVIDDGSEDDPASIVAAYPDVRFIRQSNAGLAAARNAGLAAVRAELVTFLDADDILCPEAISRNVDLFAAHPDAAFVYGSYERVDSYLKVIPGSHFRPVGDDPYEDFLIGNLVGMHATVLYSSRVLRAVGGFDPTLRACEDYDTYLRLASRYPVACHPHLAALYRFHGENMSADPEFMLGWALEVHSRHKPSRETHLKAWRRGEREWRYLYRAKALDLALPQGLPAVARTLVKACRLGPGYLSYRLRITSERRRSDRLRRQPTVEPASPP